MNVIVASPAYECPAHFALEAEFQNHRVAVCEGDYAYGGLLQQLWNQGDSFIIIEHDVVPWPGAIKSLIQCDKNWCAFEYPLNFLVLNALGCTKFSTQLIQQHARIAHDWHTIHWGALDGAVIPRLQSSGHAPHIHSPPVAHVRKY